MISKFRKYINYNSQTWKYFSFLNPNQWTFLGLLFSILAGWKFYNQDYVMGAVLVILSGLSDLIDGGVARHTHSKTRYGAILDASMDRLGEGVIYAGLVTQYPQAIWALIFSYMVSYVRAKRDEIKVGVAERGERLALLVLFALTNFLNAGLWVIAGLAGISFLMRLDYARHSL